MSSMNCVIGVIGGKGGVGKSVFTANLALSAQKELRAPCLLMDLDNKSCGDQNIILGLKPLKTVSEFINYKGVISQNSLKSILSQHSSGLAYLAAVKSPEQSLSGDPRLFSQQLMSLEQNYKYIFVDMGCEVGELQVEVLNRVSVLLVLVTPEILVINQTRRILNELMAATLPTQLLQIIVNKHTSAAVQASTIQQVLKLPILNFIPNDEAVSAQALSSSRPFILSHPNTAMARSYHQVIRQLTGGILQRNKQLSRSKMSAAKKPSAGVQKEDISSDENMDSSTLLKLQVHSELIQEMDLNKDLTKAKTRKAEDEIRTKASRIVTRLVDEKAKHLSRQERSQVIKQVLDEAVGLGALEELLADRSVTEIMVNGASQIYCEKSGKIQLSPVTFTSNMHLKNVIERIVTPLGRRIDEKTPYVDARLADGSRVNAVIEPLSIDGPAVTIRKFPSERIVAQDLVKRFGSLTSAMADFLKICVEQGLNIIISGGTGSGKTTLLNVMSAFIPERERIITVEDAAELQMKQTHVVRLETRPANMEGTGEISIRDLIRNSLRMRPDRIVVGECRDGAALDMLSAMNTGHDGSMTTVHANNPREAVARLETLCLMAGMELPAKAIREQIAGAVNLIVQISRLSDGSRKIKSITEVAGIQGDVVTLQEIFRFKESGFDKNRKIIGQFQAMGRIPSFIERFEQRGLKIPRDLFTTQQSAGSAGKISASGSAAKPKLGPSRVIRPLPPKKAAS